MMYRLSENKRDHAIGDNVRKNWKKRLLSYQYAPRDIYPGSFIRTLFGVCYTISWKNTSLQAILLSIPRRVCRARVSRLNSQG